MGRVGSPRVAAWSLCIGAVLGGCATYSVPVRCPRGQARVGEQCVPTPSLVFSRCVEAFRRTRSETTVGSDTTVGAHVAGQGGGTISHARGQGQADEYATVSEDLLPEAIAECRRQEEQERRDEIGRAWAAADDAERKAAEATAESEQLRRRADQTQADDEAMRAALEELSGPLGPDDASAVDDDTARLAELPTPPDEHVTLPELADDETTPTSDEELADAEDGDYGM